MKKIGIIVSLLTFFGAHAMEDEYYSLDQQVAAPRLGTAASPSDVTHRKEVRKEAQDRIKREAKARIEAERARVDAEEFLKILDDQLDVDACQLEQLSLAQKEKAYQLAEFEKLKKVVNQKEKTMFHVSLSDLEKQCAQSGNAVTYDESSDDELWNAASPTKTQDADDEKSDDEPRGLDITDLSQCRQGYLYFGNQDL